MRIAAALLLTLLAPLGEGRAEDDASGARPPVAASMDAVSFTRAFGLVYIELEWDGAARLALLDTGANASAIDPRIASDLPVLRTAEVLGTTGTVLAEIVAVAGLHLGKRELRELQATRRDLAGLLSPDERNIDLILGSDAFAGLALTLDFRRSQLELREAAECEGPCVALLLEEGIPAISARLGELEVVLRIDTGASLFPSDDVYVNVPAAVLGALRERRTSLTTVAHLQGTGADGQTVDLPVVELAAARIGVLDLERVFLVVQPEQGYFAKPGALGFVGNNYLDKLGRVTLDFRTGQLCVEP